VLDYTIIYFYQSLKTQPGCLTWKSYDTDKNK